MVFPNDVCNIGELLILIDIELSYKRFEVFPSLLTQRLARNRRRCWRPIWSRSRTAFIFHSESPPKVDKISAQHDLVGTIICGEQNGKVCGDIHRFPSYADWWQFGGHATLTWRVYCTFLGAFRGTAIFGIYIIVYRSPFALRKISAIPITHFGPKRYR